MRNYGFEYLVEKVEIINEMAKPSFWKRNYPKFDSEIYMPVTKLMGTVGNVGSSHVREKTIEYLVVSLLEKLNIKINGSFSDYVRKMVKTGPGKNYTPEFANWLEEHNWTWSPQKEKEFALYSIVDKYESKILNPKIKDIILDSNNIIEYLDAPSETLPKKIDNEINDYEDIEYILQKEKESGSTDTELNRKRLKLFIQGRTNLTPEDIQYIKSHKFMNNDGMSMDENDIRDLINSNKPEKETVKSSAGRRIPKTSHAAQIYDQKLKNRLSISRQEMDYIFSQARPLLKQIRQMSSTAKKGKLEVSNTSDGSPENDFADALLDEIDNIKTLKINPEYAETKNEKILAKHPQVTEELLDDLTDFISNAGGMTKELFGDKISTYNSKDITALGNYLIGMAKSEVSSNTPNESDKYDGYDEDVLFRVLDTPEKKKIFKDWYNISRREIERIRGKQYSKNNSESYETNDENGNFQESRVLDYMSEQIKKDSHINQIGEYKDRGFKKQDKYSYWTI
jgi:hypothetical protein